MEPSITLDIKQSALIDAVTGKILKDPCTSNCGCNLTLGRKTWMTISMTDGSRKCPNPTCKKPFSSLAPNWFAASLLKTKGFLTAQEHFEEQKRLQEEERIKQEKIKGLLSTFDSALEAADTEKSSTILKQLQAILPGESSDLQTRTRKLFEVKESELKKRKLFHTTSSLKQGESKRQRKTEHKELSAHRVRLLEIRKRREQALNIVVKKEVLESMMPDDDDDNDQIETDAGSSKEMVPPDIPPIVGLPQIFSKIGDRETYDKAEILSYVTELIEMDKALSSKEKRNLVDPLWRDCYDPVKGLELTKTQLKDFLTAINRGYQEFKARIPALRATEVVDSSELLATQGLGISPKDLFLEPVPNEHAATSVAVDFIDLCIDDDDPILGSDCPVFGQSSFFYLPDSK